MCPLFSDSVPFTWPVGARRNLWCNVVNTPPAKSHVVFLGVSFFIFSPSSDAGAVLQFAKNWFCETQPELRVDALSRLRIDVDVRSATTWRLTGFTMRFLRQRRELLILRICARTG